MNTLKGKIRITTIYWSLFFVLSLLIANLFIVNYKGYLTREEKSFGGPVISLTGESAALAGSLTYPLTEAETRFQPQPQLSIEEALAIGASNPLSNVSLNRNGLISYKVIEGDTLSGIAANFGVSIETLKWANPGLKNLINPGQEIVVLPVSGILYQAKDGDSAEAVLNRYGVSFEIFKKYNPGYQEAFTKSKTVILPYATPIKEIASISRYTQGLPDLKTYFALPARGWNWGELHDFNAVDIADACGKPIYASAEGLVIEDSGNNRWNDGYGNYVLIEHPNGTKTRYAHTLKNLVGVGDYVAQGDQIALIGSTGNTHGPTGCHLHFEVYGAKNPFAIR